MRTVTLTTRLVARPDVLSCAVGDDGTVLLDPGAGVYLGVDGPAALMWAMLSAGPVPVAALCEAVLQEYDVSRDVCEADVRAFVDDLLRRGLVSRVDQAGDVRHAP